MGFPGGSVVNNPPANTGDAGDWGLIPGSGRSPGEGNGNPLQYSRQESPMDRGAWWVTVHGVAKSRTQLSAHTHTHTHTHTLAPKAKPIFSLLNTVLPSGFTPVVRSVNKKPMQPQLSED